MKYFLGKFYSQRRANTTAGRKLFANVTLWTETRDAYITIRTENIC